MDRREFIKCACAGGAALLNMEALLRAQEKEPTMKEKSDRPFTVRPHQLLCMVCSVGEGDAGGGNEKIRRIREAVREAPDMPLAIACNAGDVYVYQEPGTQEDTPEGADFNRKRGPGHPAADELGAGNDSPRAHRLPVPPETHHNRCGHM